MTPVIKEITWTPVPSPTEPENTPSGTILALGQTFKADGVELALVSTRFCENHSGGPCYVVGFTFKNNASSTILVELWQEQFWASDNTGKRYDMEDQFHPDDRCTFTGYGEPVRVSVESGQRFKYNWLNGGWYVNFYVPATDPRITEITVHVSGLSRISEAMWSIPIEH